MGGAAAEGPLREIPERPFLQKRSWANRDFRFRARAPRAAPRPSAAARGLGEHYERVAGRGARGPVPADEAAFAKSVET